MVASLFMFFLSVFAYFSFFVQPVASPPSEHDRDATTVRFCLFCRCFHLLRLLSVLSYFPCSFSSFILVRRIDWFFLASFSVARVSHDETKLNRESRRSVTSGFQGNGEGGDSGRMETAVDESRKEMADRVLSTRPTTQVEPAYSMLLVPQTAAAASKVL